MKVSEALPQQLSRDTTSLSFVMIGVGDTVQRRGCSTDVSVKAFVVTAVTVAVMYGHWEVRCV